MSKNSPFLGFLVYSLNVERPDNALNFIGVLSPIELEIFPNFLSFSISMAINNAEFIEDKANFKLDLYQNDDENASFSTGNIIIDKKGLIRRPEDEAKNILEVVNVGFDIKNFRFADIGLLIAKVYWNEIQVGYNIIKVLKKV